MVQYLVLGYQNKLIGLLRMWCTILVCKCWELFGFGYLFMSLPWLQVESDHNFEVALGLCASFAEHPPTKRDFQAIQLNHYPIQTNDLLLTFSKYFLVGHIWHGWDKNSEYFKNQNWDDLGECDDHHGTLVALLEGCAYVVLAALQIEPMEGTPLSWGWPVLMTCCGQAQL